MRLDSNVTAAALTPLLDRFFSLSGEKIRRLSADWDPSRGTPVFTVGGNYTTRGWTEWTEGFMYGCQILQFDATDAEEFLELGRRNTIAKMAAHVSHTGVHDHGFNNVSTYGNLSRLAQEGRTEESAERREYYALALKASGATQASRWSTLADGTGFLYSFNGPHSLFSDTIRSCRILMLADLLGHVLMAENDRRISLLDRAMQHMRNTLRYNVYYGEGRDRYDVPGRVAHESIFNMNDGNYRCPSTQQGYSPFSTWTRGLAWVLLGCAEELECFNALPKKTWSKRGASHDFLHVLERGARVTADFFIAHTALDGIPFWDTGAPGLAQVGAYQKQVSQPDNPHEPVDSSAAVIAAQGLLRLGNYLGDKDGARYTQAGLTVSRTLFSPPYLSVDPNHHGLLLHSVYHRPNGWDHIPAGKKVPLGESSMWGDYHAMELAVYLQRLSSSRPYLTFFGRA